MAPLKKGDLEDVQHKGFAAVQSGPLCDSRVPFRSMRTEYGVRRMRNGSMSIFRIHAGHEIQFVPSAAWSSCHLAWDASSLAAAAKECTSNKYPYPYAVFRKILVLVLVLRSHAPFSASGILSAWASSTAPQRRQKDFGVEVGICENCVRWDGKGYGAEGLP